MITGIEEEEDDEFFMIKKKVGGGEEIETVWKRLTLVADKHKK